MRKSVLVFGKKKRAWGEGGTDNPQKSIGESGKWLKKGINKIKTQKKSKE